MNSRVPNPEAKSTIVKARSMLEPLAIATVIAFLVIAVVLTFEGFRRLRHHRLVVRHTSEVLLALEQAELALINAETGQRGYIITGREEYLEPFKAGVYRIEDAVDQLAKLTDGDPLHTEKITELRKLVGEKTEELQIAIAARREVGIEAAQAAVNEDIGKKTMDRIRQEIGQIRDVESKMIVGREAIAEATYSSGLLTAILTTTLALSLVGAVLYLIEHNRRRAEKTGKQLRASQDQLRMTLDSAGLGTWHIDPKSNTLTGDEQFHKLFGREGQSLTYQEAFACLHADDREPVREAIEDSTRTLDPQPYAIEYRVVHGDGSLHWLSAKGRANFDGGELTTFDGTIVDITDRKRVDELIREADSQFRLLADNMPQLAWTALPGMTGYELVKQLRERADLQFVHCVAMTGFGQESDRDRAIQSGFDEHMVKPVDVERLNDLFTRLSAKRNLS